MVTAIALLVRSYSRTKNLKICTPLKIVEIILKVLTMLFYHTRVVHPQDTDGITIGS